MADPTCVVRTLVLMDKQYVEVWNLIGPHIDASWCNQSEFMDYCSYLMTGEYVVYVNGRYYTNVIAVKNNIRFWQAPAGMQTSLMN